MYLQMLQLSWVRASKRVQLLCYCGRHNHASWECVGPSKILSIPYGCTSSEQIPLAWPFSSTPVISAKNKITHVLKQIYWDSGNLKWDKQEASNNSVIDAKIYETMLNWYDTPLPARHSQQADRSLAQTISEFMRELKGLIHEFFDTLSWQNWSIRSWTPSSCRNQMPTSWGP